MQNNFGINSGNAQFLMKSLKINRPIVSFYKDVWWDIFQRNEECFSDCVTQYFVDIFSEPPKSQFANNFRN